MAQAKQAKKTTPNTGRTTGEQRRQPWPGLRELVTDGAYATLGAGDYTAEILRGLPGRASEVADQGRTFVSQTPRRLQQIVKEAPESLSREYRERVGGYAERGRKLVSHIQDSRATQHAVEQTRTARSQVKGAVTSLRKVVDSGASVVGSTVEQLGSEHND